MCQVQSEQRYVDAILALQTWWCLCVVLSSNICLFMFYTTTKAHRFVLITSKMCSMVSSLSVVYCSTIVRLRICAVNVCTCSFTLNYTIHYTTLHYTTLHYTTLHYTTLHYTTLHYTTLHYTTLHYTTLHYTTLHYTTLHYTTLHYTTLHYTTLHCRQHVSRRTNLT